METKKVLAAYGIPPQQQGTASSAKAVISQSHKALRMAVARWAVQLGAASQSPSFIQQLLALPTWHRRGYATPSDFNVLEGVAEAAGRVHINGYDDKGFTINGVDVSSSVLCMGGLAVEWKPRSMAEVTPDSLAVFEVLEPLPELLILGCGARMHPPNPRVREYLRSKGIKLELVSTRHAASTYNVLSEEGRQVAAALLIHGAQ